MVDLSRHSFDLALYDGMGLIPAKGFRIRMAVGLNVVSPGKEHNLRGRLVLERGGWHDAGGAGFAGARVTQMMWD